MKRRIAVLITEAFATPGGVQLVNRNIARALAMHPSLQADFFSLNDSAGDERYLPASAFTGFARNHSAFLRGAGKAFLSRRYNTLLVTHRNLFPLVLLWKALGGGPYLLFAHGVEIWNRQSALYGMALGAAKTILTNSRFTRDRVCASNQLPPEQFQVLPLCLDDVEVADETAPPAAGDAIRLLTVARSSKVEAYKGQDAVIRAMPQILRRFPGARYTLAGGGDDQPRLAALAAELGVANSVELLGRISTEERNNLFRQSTLFVMPSRGEGFGLAYLEAMHYRLPCIAGNGDGGREVVHDGVNGLTVDPGDPGAVGGAIERLLGDLPLRQRMGEAGYRMCHGEFSFASFSQSLYQAL